MTRYSADMAELLSPRAEVLHTKWRFNLKKRIVRLNGETFVMYRFRRKAMLERFEKTLLEIAGAGVTIQPARGRTATSAEYASHGYWIALGHVPGVQMGKPTRGSIVSLASNLARLHSLEGPSRKALFQGKDPQLPHRAYVGAEPSLTERQKQWVHDSSARLRTADAGQLTHGDLFSGNIIRAPDDTISLIDYELLAYDASGIELASALLRHFCRPEQNRKLLLETYLANCSPALRAAWEKHAHDFIFAAAAKLALSRQQRARNVARKDYFDRLQGRLLPLPAVRAASSRRHEKNVVIIKTAQAHEHYYRHVARTAIDECAAGRATDALSLLLTCNRSYVEPTS